MNKINQYRIAWKRKSFENWINLSIKNRNISFISQNCIGGRFYNLLNLSYKSPTVGLWFEPEDFLNFVQNLKLNLNSEIFHDVEESNKFYYPIGRVNGIKIHFMHYENIETARIKWAKRAARVDFNNLAVLMTDRDGCSSDHRKRFFSLPFEKKIFFSNNPLANRDSEIYISGYDDQISVGDLYGSYECFDARSVKRSLLKILN